VEDKLLCPTTIVGYGGGGAGKFRGWYKGWRGQPVFGERVWWAPLFSAREKKNIDILAIYGHSEAQKVPKCLKSLKTSFWVRFKVL
jgi:hypothetical protein